MIGGVHSSSAKQPAPSAAEPATALARLPGVWKTPPRRRRMASKDLPGAVFPDPVACLENIVGEREVPDHLPVNQTMQPRTASSGRRHHGGAIIASSAPAPG